MSNLVTVNSGSAIDGSLKAGRVAISTDSTVNPSSGGKTWYNMINPAEGYVFISDPKVQGYNDGSPIIYPTQTSLPADILATINGLPDRVGSVPFDNVWDALSWLGHNGKYFLLDKTLNGTIAEGITMYMSPESLASYPQSGSTVYNLGGTANGTLANGPVWSYDGYFDFDGTDDYLTLGSSAASLVQGKTAVTMGILFKLDATASLRGLIGTLNYNCTKNLGLVASGTTLSFYNDTTTCYAVNAPTAISTGKWIFAVGTYDGTTTRIYMVQDGTMSQNSGTSKSGATNTFASDFRVMGNEYSSYFTNGQCAQAFVYDRALSEDEIWDLYYKSPIVTSGLIYALDPSNIVSYPKTGTTVYSLKGSNSATLDNGIGFENSFGGEFVFDGTDDRINASFDTLPSNGGSIEVWIKRKNTNTNAFTFGKVGTSTNRYYLRQPSADTLDAVRGNPLSAASFGTLNPDEYYHLVMAWDSSTIYAYKDGVLQNSAAYTNPGTDITDGLIGDGPGNHMGMDLAQFRLYNKTLSPTEVTQNYNAERPRFKSSRDITKEDLVLELDAHNPDSYLSGTTWADLSGNGRDGTLTNNPTFDLNNGGAINFDGTDDYVSVSNFPSSTSAFTMVCWFIKDSNSNQSFLGRTSGGSGTKIIFLSNNNIFFRMIEGGSSSNFNIGYSTSLNGKWNLLVATRSSSGVVKASLNGEALTSGATLTGTFSPIAIGRNGDGQYFDGKMSNIRMYSRELSLQEIQSIYTTESPRYNVQLPHTVTDSLKLNLDAGDITSYSRTGTTWYDRSGNGNNATLYNSPTYTIAEGGVFDLDGTDDYFRAPASAAGMYNFGTNGTLEMWFRPDASYTSNHRLLCVTNNASAIDVYINPSGELRLHGNQAYATQTVPINEWTHLVVTYVGGNVQIYFNGEAQTMAGTKLTGYNITNNNDLWIGQFSGGGSYYFNGKIANTKIYHRGLNPSEVLENYKSTRSRFGTNGIVTSNLQVHWDLSNPNSFDNSSTTITDLQGTQNGTIINGMPFDPQNGGVIQSDGTNDYITAGTLGYTNYSILMWVKTSSPNSTFTTVGHRTFVGSTGFRFQWDDDNTTQGRGPFIDFTSGGGSVTGTTFSPQEWFNKWQQVGVTRTSGTVKIYWNGGLINTGAITGQNLDNFRVGIDGLSGIGGSDQINRDGGTVEIGDLMIYNDVLTDAEVLQNYTALKNRFGKD